MGCCLPALYLHMLHQCNLLILVNMTDAAFISWSSPWPAGQHAHSQKALYSLSEVCASCLSCRVKFHPVGPRKATYLIMSSSKRSPLKVDDLLTEPYIRIAKRHVHAYTLPQRCTSYCGRHRSGNLRQTRQLTKPSWFPCLLGIAIPVTATCCSYLISSNFNTSIQICTAGCSCKASLDNTQVL